MAFEFKQLALPEIILVTPRFLRDARGFFAETYRHSDFCAAGIKEVFLQDNLSSSVKGVIRGLHYQNPPKAQAKLVRCVRGTVFDVAVDIRKGSPHYGRWAGEILDAENGSMLYIPAGFAHGFTALSETADVAYKVSAEYSPQHERGIRWNDSDISISWPVSSPIVSIRDAGLPLLRDADNLFT
ncbi:MAG: dTDP-4-dehydrorhamnose 3,5-epimerase [bacterium]